MSEPTSITERSAYVFSNQSNFNLFENKSPINLIENLSEGDTVYIQLSSQATDGGKIISGFVKDFYPCKVKRNKDGAYLETLTRSPSWPPGYGCWHSPGERKEIKEKPIFILKDQSQ
jgi:hypothetical protein